MRGVAPLPQRLIQAIGFLGAAALCSGVLACATTQTPGNDTPEIKYVADYRTPTGGGLPAAAKLFKDGDLPAALESAESHVTANPSDPAGYYTLGTLQLISGELDAARTALLKCLELDAGHGAALNNLGLVELKAHSYADAADAFRRAGKLRRNDPEPMINLGAALVMKGSIQGAVVAYEEALIRSPRNQAARLGLANALSHTGRPQDAVHEYKEILKKEKDLLDAHIGLSTVLRHMNRLRQARQHADRALQLAPKNPVALLAAARIREEQKDFKNAEGFYKKALESAPTHLDILYNYGTFLEARGRKADAKATFEAYLKTARPGTARTRHVKAGLERLSKP